MVAPGPDKDYSATMNDPDWIKNNNPNFSDDDWNPEAALDGDGVGAALQQSPIIVNGDGSSQTISCWYLNGASFDNEMLYAQGPLNIAGTMIGLYHGTTNNNITAVFKGSASPVDRIFNTTSALNLNDGFYHHVLATAQGSSDTVKIFIDGILKSGVTSKTNDGWQGMDAAGAADTTVGTDSVVAANTILQIGSSVTRLKVWRTFFFSDNNDVTLEFNAEVAAKGEGFFNLEDKRRGLYLFDAQARK